MPPGTGGSKDEIGWSSVRGHTSGELLLAWLFQRASMLPPHQHKQAITAALCELCTAPAAIKSANLILTTGEQLYAFRFAPDQHAVRPLYLSRRRTCLVVASEPLTSDPSRWQPLDNGTLLVADTRLDVHTLQLTADGDRTSWALPIGDGEDGS